MKEAEEDLSDQKPWSAGYMREEGICQENILNLNASCATKRGIPRSSALKNQ